MKVEASDEIYTLDETISIDVIGKYFMLLARFYVLFRFQCTTNVSRTYIQASELGLALMLMLLANTLFIRYEFFKNGGSRLGESLIRKSSKRAKLTLAANFLDVSNTP